MYKNKPTTHTHAYHFFKTIWLSVCMLYFQVKSVLVFFFVLFCSVLRSPEQPQSEQTTAITHLSRQNHSSLPAMYHTKGGKVVEKYFSSAPEYPFSHHTPGQIMFQVFEWKPQSNFTPGNGKKSAKYHDFNLIVLFDHTVTCSLNTTPYQSQSLN